MKKSLHELRVLITRPEPDGLALSEQVNIAGGKAIYFPTIFIRSLMDTVFLNQLDQQDWLIFISPQAVYTSGSAILLNYPQLFTTFKVAAIGAGTANALKALGFLNVLYPEKEWNSAGLMNLPVFQTMQGKKVTLFRGKGGKENLANTLLERGAILTQIECYARCLPDVDVSVYLDLVRKKEIDILVSTSGEGLINLTVLLQQELTSLLSIPVVVISQRMMDIAHELGFKKILLAKNATHDAIMTLLSHFQEG